MPIHTDKNTGANSTFAIGGVSCSADSFVVAESLVLRINFSGEKPAHRKSAKRSFSPTSKHCNQGCLQRLQHQQKMRTNFKSVRI